jgi:hypothetical protein
LSLLISYSHRLWGTPSLPRSISPAGRATFDEAVTEMADARRDYAHDWQDHLLNAANHRENRGLPQQVVG